MSSARLHEMIAAYGAGAYRDSEAVQNLDEVMTLLSQLHISERPTPPLLIREIPAVHICTKCGTKVHRDEQDSWIDQTGGDGCEVGVHSADPNVFEQEPAVACPYCEARNSIQIVDISERWNPCQLVFKDGHLMWLIVSQVDSDHETDRVKCGTCDETILLPAGVEDHWG